MQMTGLNSQQMLNRIHNGLVKSFRCSNYEPWEVIGTTLIRDGETDTIDHYFNGWDYYEYVFTIEKIALRRSDV